jgi:hypothetical protein
MTRGSVLLRERNLRLHWVGASGWFASRGYDVWCSPDEGASWTRRSSLKASSRQCSLAWRLVRGFSRLTNWFARHPFLAQAGRLGIHSLVRLSGGTLLCIADRTVLRSTDDGASFLAAFADFQGHRPLRMGICQDHLGRVYLGEYSSNRRRDAVRLWRSDDDAVTWHPVHTWPPGSIRHVHFVQFDPYDRTIWVGTGDANHESQIACSRDGGISFEAIGGGTQLWRAVSVIFTPAAVFWGTDIGADQQGEPNHIVRWDRSARSLQTLMKIHGPAYYSTQMLDGRLAIGTAVERAEDELEKRLHLYWTQNGYDWHGVHLWPKWPAPGLLGPSTITFPLSDLPLPRLLFNANFIRSRFDGSLFEII